MNRVFLWLLVGFIANQSCSDDRIMTLQKIDYSPLVELRQQIVNRLDTAVVGIVEGTYPKESIESLEKALDLISKGLARARAGDLILQFEADNLAFEAEKSLKQFDDSRIVILPPGTPAELYVNGIDSKGYIDFGSSPEYGGGPQFTVETWAKYDENFIEFAYGSFISTFISPLPYKGWTLHYWGVSNSLLRFSIGTDHANPDLTLPTIATPAPATYGQWFHIAAVHNASANSIQLYINGELKSSTPVDANMVVNSADDMRMRAFVEPKDKSRCMSGYIKNFRLWRNAKTGEEIKQLMSSDVTGTESDLICAWDFDVVPENDGTIPDKTGRHEAKLVGLYKWKETN